MPHRPCSRLQSPRRQTCPAGFLLTTSLAFASTSSWASSAERAAPEAPAGRPGTRSADDKATRDDYALDTSKTSATIKRGGDGQFSLVITPKNGKKFHPDAPLELTLESAGGLKPAKQRLGRADIVDKSAAAPEIRTALRAETAGVATLGVTVSFFLCTDEWCQRMTDKADVTVTVEP